MIRRYRVIAALGFAAGATTLALPSVASADVGAATTLFKAAKELMKNGDIPGACAKFEASYAEDAALGALLNLADCREKEGRIAAAWTRFGEAVEKAHKLEDKREEFAQTRRDALAPRVAYLTVQVEHPVEGLTIYRGEQAVDPGAFGVALPVDPVDTVIQVTRGDDVFYKETVNLGDGEKRELKLDLKKIYDSAPSVKKKREHFGDPSAPVKVPFWSGQRIAGLVVSLVGVAGAGAGFGLGGVALQKKADSGQSCVASGAATYCAPRGTSTLDSARTFANAEQWTLIGAGGVFAVGATIFITAPKTTSAGALDTRAELDPRLEFVAPILSPSMVGVSAGGHF